MIGVWESRLSCRHLAVHLNAEPESGCEPQSTAFHGTQKVSCITHCMHRMEQQARLLRGPLVIEIKVSTTVGIKRHRVAVKEWILLPIRVGNELVNLSALLIPWASR
jgi:hypothetical protein